MRIVRLAALMAVFGIALPCSAQPELPPPAPQPDQSSPNRTQTEPPDLPPQFPQRLGPPADNPADRPAADNGAADRTSSTVNVRSFGAVGDGATDDTRAFQQAMDAVAAEGGVVTVPTGTYLIKTHLNVPARVTLQGIWKAPAMYQPNTGSTLLAVESAGFEVGTPFITLNESSTLRGLTVYYPDQKPDAIVPYPWCVASGGGANSAIIDCMLVNPYQGVDFGTRPAMRHLIRGLYGQPLRRGLFVDQCFDIGRIEDVHFWPFWTWEPETGIREWQNKNGEAFLFGRSDWEYVFNTFAFGYAIGYQFVKTRHGAMNGNLVGIGADWCKVSLLVEQTQPAGLLITNGNFVSNDQCQILVLPAYSGAAQFTNCSFWGPGHNIARIQGTGTVTFNACNFAYWDHQNQNQPAIDLSGGDLIVTGCNFQINKPQLHVRQGANSAIFTSNRVTGALQIANPARADLQVGLNAVGRRQPQQPQRSDPPDPPQPVRP